MTGFRGRRHWIALVSPLAGLAALIWLLIRSGAKPSRLAYPCQRAALSAAWLAFAAPVIAGLVLLRRRLRIGPFSGVGLAFAAVGAVCSLGLWGYLSFAQSEDPPPVFAAPLDYRAEVFHKADCPRDPVGDRFPGLDDLVEIMGGGGLKFFRSDTSSLTAGPNGILAADDTVLVKINYQWGQRGGTNTDLLSGLIRRIVEHPDGFTGEVVVCENAQFNSTVGFDRAENNAEDVLLSPHDVVTHFKTLGYRVSHQDWTLMRYASVTEYSTGNVSDGYVLLPYDPTLAGRPSYPKFTTEYGTRISFKLGLWTASGGYDRNHLKVINVPVLKSHHSAYGATASVKHYMGVVTRELSTNSHSAIANGLLGAVIGAVGPADLNIVDAIWINANPYSGPSTDYAEATRRDELVASLDPVAADIWSVKNILIPGFVSNGYSPPWPAPSADPDLPTSAFRRYIDASMNRILAAGYKVTNNPTMIDEIETAPPGEPADPAGANESFLISKQEGGAYALTWSPPIRGGAADEYELYSAPLPGPRPGVPPHCEAALGSGTSAFLTSLPGGMAFLVVGRNAAGDGSFGHNSAGYERPGPAVGSLCP